MAIPHRCPICEGRGEVGKRLAQVGSVLVSEKPQRFRCHGCHGAGIIWDYSVNVEPQQPINIQPWVPNTTPQWPDGTIISTNKGDCPGIVNSQHTTGYLQPVEDGVARCSDCKEPLYKEPAKGCQRASSHMRPVANL